MACGLLSYSAAVALPPVRDFSDGDKGHCMNMIEPLTNDLSFKALTVNLHKGFAALNGRFVLPELRHMLQQTQADIVFLQEVVGANSAHSTEQPYWPHMPQYEYLADSIWSDYAYGRNAVYPDGHHGNALLSKFPIVESHNLDISFNKTEKRGLLYCRLLEPTSGTYLNTICVHLGLRERHRQRQLKLLCNLIDTLPEQAPLIVAGDFNDWRLKANRILATKAGLVEVFSTGRSRPAATFPARWPLLRLDRIYVRELRLRQPNVLTFHPWPHLSDHLPITAELALTPAQASTVKKAS